MHAITNPRAGKGRVDERLLDETVRNDFSAPGGPDVRDEPGGDDSRSDPALSTTRRALLAMAPALATSIAGCGSSPSSRDTTTENPRGTDPPTTARTTAASPTTSSPEPSQQTTTTDGPVETTPEPPLDVFDRILDAVDDLGCDPTGEVPCDDQIESAVADGVAIRFSEGKYQFERGHGFRGIGMLGFVGEGDVSFVPPSGFNDMLIEISGDWGLFKGIDVDLRTENTTAGLRFITRRGFLIEDVEFRGRGTHSNESVTNALALAVTDTSERGTVRNVVATRGSAIGHYKSGNGRVGIWVGHRHNGLVRIEGCRLEEFGNNGIYASRAWGATEVLGGLYRNNNVSGVRLGGPGSLVRGATIEVDIDRYDGPTTRTDESFNTRCIVIEQGGEDESGPVRVVDCDVRMRSAERSQGALVVWPNGNGPTIEGSRFRTEVDGVAAIRAQPPVVRVAGRDRPLEVRDCSLSGGANGGSAIDLRRRPASIVEGVTIEQTGEDRDGIQLQASDPVTVSDSSVTVSRFPLLAIEPRSTGDDCLLELGAGSRLERTTTAPAEVSTVDLPAGIDPHCIGTRIMDGLEAPEAIALTQASTEAVSWLLHSPIEPDRL